MRPRLCRKCHAPATHVEVSYRNACIIKLDGTLQRFIEPLNVFWCKYHYGPKEGT